MLPGCRPRGPVASRRQVGAPRWHVAHHNPLAIPRSMPLLHCTCGEAFSASCQRALQAPSPFHSCRHARTTVPNECGTEALTCVLLPGRHKVRPVLCGQPPHIFWASCAFKMERWKGLEREWGRGGGRGSRGGERSGIGVWIGGEVHATDASCLMQPMRPQGAGKRRALRCAGCREARACQP